ncbi:MAG: ATP-binding cassette domain-containing protein, partial [Actinobacteria bacterium]|nr:ATP-binding cassette domain-containing protein [Actinomycetota bacterium]
LEVLHGVNISIPRGSFVAIIGPNGAGKSTMCAVISGLLPPMSGQVLVAGEDVTSAPAHERVRRSMMLVPEYRGIFPGLSVEENVAVWVPDSAARLAALERFPALMERRRLPAQLLSGGEQQMLTLATALQRPPEILILDEPSLGLSPVASAQVYLTLAELHGRGTTVVLVEEQARRVLDVAREIVLLDLGRVTWQGPTGEFTEEHAQELYLGITGGR